MNPLELATAAQHCPLAAWVQPAAAALLALAIAGLEAWLRYPVEPLLAQAVQSTRAFFRTL